MAFGSMLLQFTDASELNYVQNVIDITNYKE